jgi:hypothetical protein
MVMKNKHNGWKNSTKLQRRQKDDDIQGDIQGDDIHTLAYGHLNLEKKQTGNDELRC